MRCMRLGIWLVVAVLAMASVASRTEHHRNDFRPRRRRAGTHGSGRDRERGVGEPAGHSHRRHIRERRLHLHAAAVRPVHDHVRAERIRAPAADGQRSRRRRSLPVDVTMGLAGVAETVEVVGRAADVLTQTAQVATNFSQELIASLPTNRDINATLLLAPSVHPTGPARELLDRRLDVVREPVHDQRRHGQREPPRARPNNLYIEDAIQETTIATAGVSAEYGRFGGGVVNIDHEVGRQHVQRIVPRHAATTTTGARWSRARRATRSPQRHARSTSVVPDLRVHRSAGRSSATACGSSRPAGSRSRRSARQLGRRPTSRTPSRKTRSATRATAPIR